MAGKTYRRPNLFMAKTEFGAQPFASVLAADVPIDSYPLADSLGIEGILCVKRSAEKRPPLGRSS